MRLEAIKLGQQKILKELYRFKDFYLVGGTGLAFDLSWIKQPKSKNQPTPKTRWGAYKLKVQSAKLKVRNFSKIFSAIVVF